MPHGVFTVEQWKRPQGGAATQWTPILHLDSCQSLTKAMAALKKRGEPGLFRVVQMRRCVWAEMEGGKLRLHGSHASSPENLGQIVEIFEREGGATDGEGAASACRSQSQTRQKMTSVPVNREPGLANVRFNFQTAHPQFLPGCHCWRFAIPVQFRPHSPRAARNRGRCTR